MRGSVLFFTFVLFLGCSSASETPPTTTGDTSDDSTPTDPALTYGIRPPAPLGVEPIDRIDRPGEVTRASARLVTDSPASAAAPSPDLRKEAWQLRDAGQ